MKKTRERTAQGESEKREAVPRAHFRRDAKKAEDANVRYFLHALNQMSLALRALGYVTEGAALVKVKVDLNNRLFHPSGEMIEIAQLLH